MVLSTTAYNAVIYLKGWYKIETFKTIYGYDIEILRAIALEMKNNDLTVEDLKSSVKMYHKGFEDGYKLCKNRYDNVINQITKINNTK